MKIRFANIEDCKKIAEFYRSLVGSPFSTWDNYYPSIKEATFDVEKGFLFLEEDDDKNIIAVASINHEDSELDCFEKNDKAVFLTRLGVARNYQGKGIASDFVRQIEEKIKEMGFVEIRLLASKENIIAQKMYNKLGYQNCGEYSGIENLDFYCFKKSIK